MAQPGAFRNPNDEAWIGREFAELKRELRELRAANPFSAMGVRPMKDGLIVDGYETVNGPLEVNGESQFNGAMTINGDAVISGALSLPEGIINNDALANPVQIGTASNGLSNYAITTASTVRASVVLTVPDGFTEAVVTANPTAMGQNSTATTDYLYVMAVVQAVSGGELYTSAAAGLGVGLAAPFHTTLTGLTGGDDITVSVATRAGFSTWAASTANQANIYATAIFLR